MPKNTLTKFGVNLRHSITLRHDRHTKSTMSLKYLNLTENNNNGLHNRCSWSRHHRLYVGVPCSKHTVHSVTDTTCYRSDSDGGPSLISSPFHTITLFTPNSHTHTHRCKPSVLLQPAFYSTAASSWATMTPLLVVTGAVLLQVGSPQCHPINTVKATKGTQSTVKWN